MPRRRKRRKYLLVGLVVLTIFVGAIAFAVSRNTSTGGTADQFAFPTSTQGDVLPPADGCVAELPNISPKVTSEYWLCKQPSPDGLWKAIATKAFKETCDLGTFAANPQAIELHIGTDSTGIRSSPAPPGTTTRLFRFTENGEVKIYETFFLYTFSPVPLDAYKTSPFVEIYLYPLAQQGEKYIKIGCASSDEVNFQAAAEFTRDGQRLPDPETWNTNSQPQTSAPILASGPLSSSVVPSQAFTKTTSEQDAFGYIIDGETSGPLVGSSLPANIPVGQRCKEFLPTRDLTMHLFNSGYADFNGDGVTDLAGFYRCYVASGERANIGDGPITVLDGASTNPGKPTILGTLDLDFPANEGAFKPEVDSVAIDRNNVYVYMRYWRADPPDANCCPFGRRVLLYTYSNGKFELIDSEDLTPENENFFEQ